MHKNHTLSRLLLNLSELYFAAAFSFCIGVIFNLRQITSKRDCNVRDRWGNSDRPRRGDSVLGDVTVPLTLAS